jgi:hypothetical protein
MRISQIGYKKYSIGTARSLIARKTLAVEFGRIGLWLWSDSMARRRERCRESFPDRVAAISGQE